MDDTSKISIDNASSQDDTSMGSDAKVDSACDEITQLNSQDEIATLVVKVVATKDEHQIKYVCDICSDDFDTRQSLQIHKKNHDEEVDSLQCTICQKHFRNRGALYTHVKSHTHNVHTGEMRHESLESQHLQTGESKTKSETEEAVEELKYSCDICKKKFKGHGGLVFHKQIHEGEKNLFKCHICGSILNNKGALKAHVRSHKAINDGDLKCQLCDRMFKDRESLKTHQDSHEEKYLLDAGSNISCGEWSHKCTICNQSFRRRGYYLKHMKKHHPDAQRTGLSNLDNVGLKSEICLDDVSERISAESNVLENMKDGPYVCKMCGKEFTRKNGFLRHIEIHARDKYQCKVCNKRFPNEDDFIQHKKLLHHAEEEKEMYLCTLCEPNKVYKIKSCYDKHLQNHTSEKPAKFACKICGKWFDELVYLRQHLKVHSEHRPYKCKVCGQTFKYNVPYRRHMLSHPGQKERFHVCPVCDKSFVKPYLLKAHLLTHSKDSNKPYKCQTCSKGFISKFRLHKHERNHSEEKLYNCDICGQAFKHRIYAKRHRLTHTGISPHKCVVCDKAFAMKLELTNHMKHCSKEISSVSEDLGVKAVKKASGETNGKSVVCTLCNKVLPNRKSWVGHMKNHPNNPERQYKCEFCNKAFTKIYVLKSHLKVIHQQILVNTKKGLEGEVIRLGISNKRLFKCPVCELVYIHHSELATHMRIHTGQMPYECSCGETFSGRSHLQHHINVKHPARSPKAHGCSVCGKRFKSELERERHMVAHAGRKPFKCVHCGHGFLTRGGVRGHIHKKHPSEEISVIEYIKTETARMDVN